MALDHGHRQHSAHTTHQYRQPPPLFYAGLLILVLFQLLLLFRWVNIDTFGRYLNNDLNTNLSSDGWEHLRKEISEQLRKHELKFDALAEDLQLQLRRREAAVQALTKKFYEREEALSSWQKQLLDAVAAVSLNASSASNQMTSSSVSTEFSQRGGSISVANVGNRNFRVHSSGAALSSLSSSLKEDDEVDGDHELSDGKSEKCNRQQDTGRKGTIKWNPNPNSFLLVMCSGGQLSNRLACIRQHMLDAALLGRTLVFPSRGIDYDYSVLLDLQQPEICFGNNTFITLEAFRRKFGKGPKRMVRVDMFVCHVHSYQRPKICEGIKTRYHTVGVTFVTTTIPEFRTPGPWYKYNRTEFLQKFSYNHTFIGFGNMFGVGGRELRFSGSRPLVVSPECMYFLTPARPIVHAAAGFVNTYLGSNYMGVHLRRGDFFHHCLKPNGEARHPRPCFHPMQQIALCLVRHLDESPGITAIYLATNGKDEEVNILQQMMALHQKPVPIVRLPKIINEKEPWALPLIRLQLQADVEVIALVEKTICVLSTVFYSTWTSTFSGDIGRLRDWWYLRTCKDSSVCPVDEPSDTIPVLTSH